MHPNPIKELKDVIRSCQKILNMFAGGPGSGHFGHMGRLGERGGSLPGESDGGTPSYSGTPLKRNGFFDHNAYSRLAPKEKEEALKTAIGAYKYHYIKVANIENRVKNLSRGAQEKFVRLNARVGQIEGRRNWAANKGWTAKGADRRKWMHFAIGLQDKARRMAQMRDSLAGVSTREAHQMQREAQ